MMFKLAIIALMCSGNIRARAHPGNFNPLDSISHQIPALPTDQGTAGVEERHKRYILGEPQTDGDQPCELHGVLAAIGGFVAGGVGGAALGSFIPIPIVGTVIGALLGAIFGGAAGGVTATNHCLKSIYNHAIEEYNRETVWR